MLREEKSAVSRQPPTRTLTWNRDRSCYFGECKTGRSRRSVPLPLPLLHMLREHRKRQAEERLEAGPRWQSHDQVFCGKEGIPHTRDVQARHFKPILRPAGPPGSIRLYDLRHTCTTLLLVADESPKVVNEQPPLRLCRGDCIRAHSRY